MIRTTPLHSKLAAALIVTSALTAPALAQDTQPAPAATEAPASPATTDTAPGATAAPDAPAAAEAAPDAPAAAEAEAPAAAPDAAATGATAATSPDEGATDAGATDQAATGEAGTAATEGAEAAPAAETPGATTQVAAESDERAPQPQPEVGQDWPFWGGDANAQRYSPLDQITPENVGNLERAWTFHTGDLPEGAAIGKYSPENTPVKVGDALLMCSAMNILISIDAATGEENWRYDPKVSPDAIPYGATCRGVSVYTAPELPEDAPCKTRVIEGTVDARLIAADTRTGELCQDFGDSGQIDLWDGIGEKVPGWYAVTAPPAIVRGIAVTGAQVKDGQAEDAPSGVIRGYDAVTGKLAWAWDLGAPEAMKNGPPEGETYTRGTPNMWTTATADEELGLVYLPLGNSSVDYWASNRSEAENDWSTSLVAIDVLTGEPKWSFQTVHKDVWDYDLGSQVTLIDYPNGDGGTVPAVILPSKQGDIYILNRETGEALTPVGEVDVPTTGELEPDTLSKTQPVSEWHTLRKDPLQEKDMWGFTPIDQLWCRIQFRLSSYDGFYTPPTADKFWIQYPGYNGGNDWGSIAYDADAGLIIANYNDIPNHNRLIPREEADELGIKPIYEQGNQGANAEGAGDAQAGSPYAINVNAGWRNDVTGVPCTAPPYGGIRAIDIKTGETVWDRPLGTARRNGPFGIPSHLPFTIGLPNNGGSVVTKGGLIFIGAATDNLFRAIDVKTGETVWSDVLDQGGQANPITYEVNGEQFVLIGPGGHHFMETPIGDEVIAYKLPKG
ncbi:pyrroloquinoline quinone-dependent dehydrogenase [Acuticoccus sediminis]|uniref:pyrroloquinoline quinone-dependent dehydrogenase n=1 Tax=Acuticoccus sediminis TaxID=2184697 RepID=UPI001CFDCAE3|nr:pyrroloquinoline quinone-dependent dehydrogenase [Acuticoccus sediminis]